MNRSLFVWTLLLGTSAFALPPRNGTGGGDDSSANTGTPGVNISVPICNSAELSTNFEVRQWTADWQRFPAACSGSACASRYSHYPTKFTRCSGNTGNLCTDIMDWGDGNLVTNVHAAICDPTAQNNYLVLAPDNGFHEMSGTMASVEGFVNNISDAAISGTVVYDTRMVNVFHTVPSMSLTLSLQVLQDQGWVTVASRPLPMCDVAQNASCGHQGASLNATVPGNSTVRMIIEMSQGYAELRIYQMSLFGAECFPDVSHPGMCLH